MTIHHHHHAPWTRPLALATTLGILALGGCLAQGDPQDEDLEEADRLGPGASVVYDGAEGKGSALDPSVCTAHGYKDSGEKTFAGNKAQRFELRPGDSKCKNKYRSELQVNDIDRGVDYWYGFALYIPNAVPANEGFTFWQIHGRKDDCENYRNPPASLALTDGQFLRVAHTWDNKKCSSNNGPKNNRDQVTIGEISRNQWQEYVIHLRMDEGGDGVFEIWQDGVQVYDFEGPVGFNDNQDPYVKWGMYSYNSPVASKAVTYMDEIRFVRNGSYADVSPSRGSNNLVNLAPGSIAKGPSNTQAANPAEHLIDDDPSTHWSAQGFSKDVRIDLGEVSTIRRLRLAPYNNRPYRYVIHTRKNSNQSWNKILDRSNNSKWSSEFVDDITPTDARYVRLRVLGVAGDVTTWASIKELEILGD
ncbi:MAG: heparin lyase I family protein [Myxococcota bacterium]